MKIIRIIALFIMCSVTSYTQDILYNMDGTDIQVKIIEINENVIKYKKFNNTEGPLYTVKRESVMMVVYENGDNVVINTKEAKTVPEKKDVEDKNFFNNVLSVNPILLINSSVMLSYERVLKSGKRGIRIPTTFSYAADNSSIYSGVEYRIYPKGQGGVKYYLGPAVIGGVLNGDNFASINFHNGFTYRPSQNFNMSLLGMVGIGYIENSFTPVYGIEFSFGPSF